MSSRLIQEEKETTEQRAEELESRVGSGTVDAMAARWQTMPEQSFERSASPTISGRSTPTPQPSLSYQSRDYLEKYNTVSGAGRGGAGRGGAGRGGAGRGGAGRGGAGRGGAGRGKMAKVCSGNCKKLMETITQVCEQF